MFDHELHESYEFNGEGGQAGVGDQWSLSEGEKDEMRYL